MESRRVFFVAQFVSEMLEIIFLGAISNDLSRRLVTPNGGLVRESTQNGLKLG